MFGPLTILTVYPAAVASLTVSKHTRHISTSGALVPSPRNALPVDMLLTSSLTSLLVFMGQLHDTFSGLSTELSAPHLYSHHIHTHHTILFHLSTYLHPTMEYNSFTLFTVCFPGTVDSRWHRCLFIHSCILST